VATVPLGVVLELQVVGKFLLQTPIAHSDLPDLVCDFLIGKDLVDLAEKHLLVASVEHVGGLLDPALAPLEKLFLD